MATSRNSVTLRIGSEGSEKVVANLRAIGESAKRNFEETSRAAQQAGKSFDALERRLDPVAKAAHDFARAQAVANTAVNSGAKSHDEAARIIDLAAVRQQKALRDANVFVGDSIKGVDRFHSSLERIREFSWNNTSFSGDQIDRVINPIGALGSALGSIPTIALASAAAAEVALTAIGGTAQRALADLAEVSRTSGLSVNQVSGAQIVGARVGLSKDQTRGALDVAGREFDAYRRNEGGVKDLLENIDEGFLKVADRARNAGEFVDLIGEKIRALPREEGLDLSKKLLGDDAGARLFDNIRNGALSMRSLADEAARAGSINDDLARRAADVQHQIDEASEIARTKLLVAFQDLGNPVDDLRLSWWRVVGSIGDAISRSEQLRQVMQGMLHPFDTLSNAPRAFSRVFEQEQQRPLGRLIDMQAQQDFERRKADFFARGPQLVQLTAGDSRRRYEQREEEDGKAAGGGRSAISDAARAEERYQSITRELNNQLGLLFAHGAEHDRLALRIEIERRQFELGTGATELQKQNVAAMVTKIDEATKAQQRLNEERKAFNEAYGAASNTLSIGIKDIIHGGKPEDALRRALSTTQDQMIDAILTGSGPFAKSLGFAGKDGATGGIFGAIGEAFGLGPKGAAEMNVKAGVVNITGASGAGGLGGGGGGLLGSLGGLFKSDNFAGRSAGAIGPFQQEGGGLLSGLFDSIGSLFGFADGGVMTSRGPLPLRRYADGGIARSPQLALFGEGSGPEAFVPLRNGGIPVHIKTPAAQKAAAPNIKVINYMGGTAQVTTSVSKGEVKIMIAQALVANNDQQSQTLLNRIHDRQRREM